MTNEQRDDLLISLVKSFNEFRVENREEHKRLEETLRAEIKAVDTKLDKSVAELKSEIKAVDTKLDKSVAELRSEIKESKDESTAEIKEAIDFNNTGITEK